MENVTMTAEERREFEAYRAEKQKKRRQNGANSSAPITPQWWTMKSARHYPFSKS